MTELPTRTIVMAEGRRMMRLSSELEPRVFEALLEEYQRLLEEVFERMGGSEVEVDGDTAMAAFPTAKQAALAAVAAQRAVEIHEWPPGSRLAMSVGLDSGEGGGGWAGPAALRCEALCDAAEGGQIFLTQAVNHLLVDEDLDDLTVRDLGEVSLRRSEDAVHAYELVVSE
jgi:class 3 adenylate cyclase